MYACRLFTFTTVKNFDSLDKHLLGYQDKHTCTDVHCISGGKEKKIANVTPLRNRRRNKL